MSSSIEIPDCESAVSRAHPAGGAPPAPPARGRAAAGAKKGSLRKILTKRQNTLDSRRTDPQPTRAVYASAPGLVLFRSPEREALIDRPLTPARASPSIALTNDTITNRSLPVLITHTSTPHTPHITHKSRPPWMATHAHSHCLHSPTSDGHVVGGNDRVERDAHGRDIVCGLSKHVGRLSPRLAN